jgi:acetyl esterase/lipase
MSEDILTVPPPPADMRLAYGPDPNQFGDLRLPKKPTTAGSPVVMNIHGGFWRAKYDLLHAGHLCTALTSAGFATWNVEYRRAGNPGGGWPGTFEDIATSYRFLPQIAERFHLDHSRVLVMGHSAGGHLALCLAAHVPSLRQVVSLAGVVNLRRAFELHLSSDAVVEFLGGKPNEVPEHYSEADPAQLSLGQARQALIHGLNDDVVSPEFSRQYVITKRKSGENVTLLEIPKADHFDLIDPRSSAWARIEETVLRLSETR